MKSHEDLLIHCSMSAGDDLWVYRTRPGIYDIGGHRTVLKTELPYHLKEGDESDELIGVLSRAVCFPQHVYVRDNLIFNQEQRIIGIAQDFTKVKTSEKIFSNSDRGWR